MTEQQKAEAYVREQRPALLKSICPRLQISELLTPNLQDWLGVLGSVCGLNKVGIDAEGYCVIKPIYKERENGDKGLFFNLTTGQPATEADYQAFNEIVSV